ncbi:MAG: HIT family protein [Candidatus Bathyarchaeota archaeon]|nr:HIT family protein [Candidatus Bathyarchaeota archaeon]
MSESCIFCKIVRKEAPAAVVYEDEQILAFMDIRPVSEGHTLVIPKQHCEDIFDTPQDLLAATHRVTQKIASAAKKATNADGISIVQQNGVAAGQDIFHLHVHIIPRFQGRPMPRFEDLTVVDREVLNRTAERVKQYV